MTDPTLSIPLDRTGTLCEPFAYAPATEVADAPPPTVLSGVSHTDPAAAGGPCSILGPMEILLSARGCAV